MTTSRFFAAMAAIAVTGALASCGDKHGDAKPASQVAVKVNGSEISVHQVNAVLARAPALPAEAAAKLKRDVVDRLVNQQLAVDRAVEKELDRNPDVMLAIESAKRDILARAYLESVAAAQTKASAEEIKKYYDDHPELFSNRRIYQIQELITAPKAEIANGLKPLVAGSKSIDEMVAWLKARNIAFQLGTQIRAAEQLPLELLPKVAALKDGQSLLVERPQGILVMRIAASEQGAIDQATATPRIQVFLSNERGQKAIEADIKKLRDDAKIEYQGEFASLPAAPASTALPESGKNPSPGGEAAAVVPGLEKGVAGMK